MKLLKVIGSLFVKLWHWIKETAWVQPLLIVGAIFAIIFSIPSFTSWVGSFSKKTSDAFYKKYQVSLVNERETLDRDDSLLSEADRLTKFLEEWSFEDKTKADYDKYVKDNNINYGEKFFLMYVETNCPDCEKMLPAVELLVNQWASVPQKNKDGKIISNYYDLVEANKVEPEATYLNIHTIYKDEYTDYDDDEKNVNHLTAFQLYLNNFITFFEKSSGRLTSDNNYYKRNAGISDENESYKHFLEADLESFETPTIILCDFTEEAFNNNKQGVSEILFGLSGSNDTEKANLLCDMWNHLDQNQATAENNKFTSLYRK